MCETVAHVRAAPAVVVNTNEIIPQGQPETLPVGISVYVILICSNPFRDNLCPSARTRSLPSCLSCCLHLSPMFARCWTSSRSF